tara:strand:- start:3889 stop:4677 length:789 start_codon:yes stop_codon:yes gene_type:complete
MTILKASTETAQKASTETAQKASTETAQKASVKPRKRKSSVLTSVKPVAKKNTVEYSKKIETITSAHSADLSELKNYSLYPIDNFYGKVKEFIGLGNTTDLAIVQVKSFTQDKLYNVSIKKDNERLYFLCDCGEQFGAGKRKKCKHIKFILTSVLQKYIKKSKHFHIGNATDLMFFMDKLSLGEHEKTQNIFTLYKDENITELLYDSETKYHLKCNCSFDEFNCKHIKLIISSFYKTYIDAYVNGCKKKKKLTDVLKCSLCI